MRYLPRSLIVIGAGYGTVWNRRGQNRKCLTETSDLVNVRRTLNKEPDDETERLMAADKRRNGRYFTVGNPFHHVAFRNWASSCGMSATTVLEPFAGRNSLIEHLEGMGLCGSSDSFDIRPADPKGRVQERDTLTNFPGGYDVCVTNPPWLAKNSASVRGLQFFAGVHDDLYKYALEKCLHNCKWVAALIPESFIRTRLFRGRLTDFVSLTQSLFSDTGHPVGMALFGPERTDDVTVWLGRSEVGLLASLEAMRPEPQPNGPRVVFNAPYGNVGLIALDDTRSESIRFCDVADLAGYEVKRTGRHITKLQVDGRIKILAWNRRLTDFRRRTSDLLMTSYKGIRKDGRYRRRLDWRLARGIIHAA